MGALEELINFTSLGMLILDEVHLPCGKVVENVIGGSGSYVSEPASSAPRSYPLKSAGPFAQVTTFRLKP